MIKFIKLIISIILSMSLISCSSIGVGSKVTIDSPKIKSIDLFGEWHASEQEKLDEKYKNYIFNFANDFAQVGETTINNPKYKLKKVDTSIYLNEEYKNTLKEILGNVPKQIDIISIYDDKGVYCDYVKLKENLALICLNNDILKVEKIEQKASKSENIQEEVKKDLSDKYYNMSCGVLLGLKSKNNDSNEGNQYDYRTLWISFENGEIKPTYEVQEIIVPRIKGLWKLEFENNTNGESEVFISKKIDTNTKNIDTRGLDKNSTSFREIKFLTDDYVGIEVLNREKKNYEYEGYKVLPLDNVKIPEGVKLSALLGPEYEGTFKNSYSAHLNRLDDERQEEFLYDKNFDTNYTMNRINGHWVMSGRVNSKIKSQTYFDFNINQSRQNKVVNFDEIYIPWSKAKEKNPWVRDMVNSPNKRLAIMLVKDNLFIYEIIKDEISTEPIKIIKINEDESVIMSEWAMGDFVNKWTESIVKEKYEKY